MITARNRAHRCWHVRAVRWTCVLAGFAVVGLFYLALEAQDFWSRHSFRGLVGAHPVRTFSERHCLRPAAQGILLRSAEDTGGADGGSVG